MSPAILPLDPVAVLIHDYSSRSPLSSWPPIPAEELHQGEMLAIRTFGSLLKDIRSPRHIYFASWRDPDPHSSLPAEQDKPPTRILFGAQFGVAPYETSPSLLETAEMFNRLDRGSLRLDLIRDSEGNFRLDALELELNDLRRRKRATSGLAGRARRSRASTCRCSSRPPPPASTHSASTFAAGFPGATIVEIQSSRNMSSSPRPGVPCRFRAG